MNYEEENSLLLQDADISRIFARKPVPNVLFCDSSKLSQNIEVRSS